MWYASITLCGDMAWTLLPTFPNIGMSSLVACGWAWWQCFFSVVTSKHGFLPPPPCLIPFLPSLLLLSPFSLSSTLSNMHTQAWQQGSDRSLLIWFLEGRWEFWDGMTVEAWTTRGQNRLCAFVGVEELPVWPSFCLVQRALNAARARGSNKQQLRAATCVLAQQRVGWTDKRRGASSPPADAAAAARRVRQRRTPLSNTAPLALLHAHLLKEASMHSSRSHHRRLYSCRNVTNAA